MRDILSPLQSAMLNTIQLEKGFDISVSESDLHRKPIMYRGWQIQATIINSHLWLRFGDTQDKLMQRSYPVIDEGLSSALSRVRLLIDLSIKLNR